MRGTVRKNVATTQSTRPIGLVNVVPKDNKVEREREYDVHDLRCVAEQDLPLLNEPQRRVFDQVLALAEAEEGGMVFVDAPGGTGKTFLLKAISAALRLRVEVLLAVMSSGIAATMLMGRSTAHKMFSIPLNLRRDRHFIYNVAKEGPIGRLLREARVILLDEITMSQKENMKAVDLSLKDCRGN